MIRTKNYTKPGSYNGKFIGIKPVGTNTRKGILKEMLPYKIGL